MSQKRNIYVIFSYYDSPIAITYPKPKEAWSSLKDAKERCNQLNRKSARNEYYVQRVPHMEPL